MASISTIDILKKKGVKDRDIAMFNDHMKGGKGSTFKELADKYGVKSPVTVSRRVKKVQKILSELEQGVKSGDITLQSKGLIVQSPDGGGGKLALPKENPFLALETFGELSGISSAGGSVMGMGAATLVQGFVREDLPYDERQKLAMKGASVLFGGLLAAYLTFNKFSGLDDADSTLRIIPETPEEDHK
jgi:hypothetical protein